MYVDWNNAMNRTCFDFLSSIFSKKKEIRNQGDLLRCIDNKTIIYVYLLEAATSSGILKAKQKLDLTFHSDKLGCIKFTKFSKPTMYSA